MAFFLVVVLNTWCIGHGILGDTVVLGGGFKYFLFSPLLGEDSHFD